MSSTWRDRRDLFLLPRLASALPATAAAQLLRTAIATSDAYAEEARNALAGARAAKWGVGDEAAFATRFRLQLALGYRDNWRLLRNPHCATPFAPEAIALPATTRAPLLIVSLHWGSAVFPLREIARKYGPTHFVSASFTRAEFAAFPLRFQFATRMQAMIETVCGAPQIFTGGGAASAIEAALRAGRNVAVLIDVPPHQVGKTRGLRIHERDFYLPDGIGRIAHETGAQVVSLLACPAPDGEAPFVETQRIGPMPDAHSLMPHCAQLLERALTRNPAAWTMWAHLPDFTAP
jgi:hypothetical protein